MLGAFPRFATKKACFCRPKPFFEKGPRNCRNNAFLGTKILKILLSAELLNMLNVFLEGSRTKCFSAVMLKMYIMLTMFFELIDPSRNATEKPNIRHYSCEKFFFQKCASFSCNVEYVECVSGKLTKKVLLSVEY